MLRHGIERPLVIIKKGYGYIKKSEQRKTGIYEQKPEENQENLNKKQQSLDESRHAGAHHA
jgi:hypothetical protein